MTGQTPVAKAPALIARSGGEGSDPVSTLGERAEACAAPTDCSKSSSGCAASAGARRDLSAALEVSERTIYRDIQDLVASGVPIEGEAGVGYVLKAGFDCRR